MSTKFRVVTRHRNVRGWAEGGNKDLSLREAYQVGLAQQKWYEDGGMKAEVEVLFVKDNGQLGDRIALFIAE